MTMITRTPAWFWLTMLPVLGGLGIVYAGNKANRHTWLYTGLFVTTLGIVLSSYLSHLLGFVWLSQIAIAFFIKDDYVQILESKTNKTNLRQADASKILATATEPVDINNCSKDDLVYGLGLPLVYANEIESARNEGYIFTHLEELMEIAAIPESYLAQLEKLIVFNYYQGQATDVSWRRCNHLSEQELIGCNLEPQVAASIVRERNARGIYNSFPDLRKRTGLALAKLTSLL